MVRHGLLSKPTSRDSPRRSVLSCWRSADGVEYHKWMHSDPRHYAASLSESEWTYPRWVAEFEKRQAEAC